MRGAEEKSSRSAGATATVHILRILPGLVGAGVAYALYRLREFLAQNKDCPVPDLEYQAFLDHFPVSKYYIDPHHNASHLHGRPRALSPPRLLRLFDWQVRVQGIPEHSISLDERRGNDPVTVLSGMDKVVHVLREARGWATARKDRVLVLMGMAGLTWAAWGETAEVREAVHDNLLQVFGRIYTVGNDVPFGVQTMPLGLVEAKVRMTGSDTATAAIAAARVDDEAKPFIVVAAFGAITEATDGHFGPTMFFNAANAANTTEALLAYRDHPHYISIPMWYWRRSHQSGQLPKVVSRRMAHKWTMSPSSLNIGLVTTIFPSRRWWSELSKFRFMLSPMGDEIQAPKNVEGLLVLTVPIIQRGLYRVAGDLQRLGFPVVVIGEWDEVTAGNLTRWWQELSPRLISFRANCLSTDGFWRIITGVIDSCH